MIKIFYFVFSISVSIISLLMMPLIIICKIWSTIFWCLCSKIYGCIEGIFYTLLPNNLIDKVYHLRKSSTSDILRQKASCFSVLSPRTRDMHLKNIQQNAAANPNHKTQNEKVLLILQKMQHLEDRVFYESKKKCKIEQQLFELNIKMIQKNSQIVNSRRENLKAMRQAQILQMELYDKQQQAESTQQIANLLEDQLSSLQSKLDELLTKDRYSNPYQIHQNQQIEL